MLSACNLFSAEPLRTWTNLKGSTVEAAYVRTQGNLVVLKKTNGQSVRIHLGQLSNEDRAYVASLKPAHFSRPPKNKTASDRRKLQWKEVLGKPERCFSMKKKEFSVINEMGIKWKWAETDHFILHYEKKMFALQVARMAEFFYHYISEDLDGPQDQTPRQSHIYVFEKNEDWQTFLSRSGGLKWSAAYVRGEVMFLQRIGNSKKSSGLLAHEMTHLVLNRFFKHRPPRWLNEGLAEWYGEFGRAAFKGTGKSRKAVFHKKLGNYYDLIELLSATNYPAENEIHNFYNTAKYFVGFLRLENGDEKFVPYLMNVVLRGQDALQALKKDYGYKDIKGEILPRFYKFAGVR